MNKKEHLLNTQEKHTKPKLLPVILLTLVCLGPYGNLILDIINHDYYNILKAALLTFPTLIFIPIVWCCYIYSLKKYKKY
ncbi:hypothetical protein [Anaerocolumna chitinilytica]|uniref:Uncharacterized protein n=1 Tax=Anaerocolumna chitinilytica TaxID=1727145 RepID=A0A7I8DMF2_9FIRM|nr:hypothetical protein [Anaerocolumna chitinilytica]BCJ99560.1 hypothetical protein bsdcttw_26010 [Anaerocolumna chitinilytica]